MTAVGYRANALSRYPTVVETHRPVFAAFGLNRMGVRALQRWKSGSDLGNGR